MVLPSFCEQISMNVSSSIPYLDPLLPSIFTICSSVTLALQQYFFAANPPPPWVRLALPLLTVYNG